MVDYGLLPPEINSGAHIRRTRRRFIGGRCVGMEWPGSRPASRCGRAIDR